MRATHVTTFFQSLCTGLPKGSELPLPPIKTPIAIHPVRRWIGPLLLMVSTLCLVLILWMTVIYFNGSILSLIRNYDQWVFLIPKPTWEAVLVIIGWIGMQWVFLRYLPGKVDTGPITANGNRPRYKFNGVLSWIITHGLLFGILYPLGILDPDALYPMYGSILITLNIGAFCICILLYIKGRILPSSSDAVYTGYFLFDFFQGVELYPMIGKTSLKQLINCRVSMMGWSVVFVSFLITQYERYGFVSPSMIASVTVLVMYLLKFFIWERGYLCSMDIMHDRFGYYICWGVLVWVPALYCLVALYLVEHTIYLSPIVTALIIIGGLVSILINFDADNQRSRVRDSGGKTKLWGKDARYIKAQYSTTDGVVHTNLLVTSGWWGVSRHFHYIPELLLAAAWTIPAGFNHILPWFYLIFLFILLMDRAGRDEKRCALKYGPYWDEYKKKVKYKVFPGLY